MTTDLGFWTLAGAECAAALDASLSALHRPDGHLRADALRQPRARVALCTGRLFRRVSGRGRRLLGGFFLAPVAVAAGVGSCSTSGLIRRMRKSGPMAQVLVTFGLIFVLLDLTRIFWGDLALGDRGAGAPERAGRGSGRRLSGLQALHHRPRPRGPRRARLRPGRTQIGAMIRAGVDNDAMAACLGINVERLFFIVFCVGCALAGLAGVVAARFSASRPTWGCRS
jgi:branched-subunit amino acid ABC-type transport system permease component